MNRGLNIPVPMASSESAAAAIFDGIENLEEDIFPDPSSKTLADGWRTGVVKTFQKTDCCYDITVIHSFNKNNQKSSNNENIRFHNNDYCRSNTGRSF